MHLLLHPLVIPICCHTVIANLTSLIMLTVVTSPQNTAAPVATLVAILAVVTVTVMINVVVNLVTLTLTTISLLIRSFVHQKHLVIAWTKSLSVHQVACLKVQHPIPIVLIIWTGTPIS